jgi:hypothetical protein
MVNRYKSDSFIFLLILSNLILSGCIQVTRQSQGGYTEEGETRIVPNGSSGFQFSTDYDDADIEFSWSIPLNYSLKIQLFDSYNFEKRQRNLTYSTVFTLDWKQDQQYNGSTFFQLHRKGDYWFYFTNMNSTELRVKYLLEVSWEIPG